MNWLAPSFAFIGAIAFSMAIRILRLDPASSLNKRLAAGCLVAGVFELSLVFVVAAPNAAWYWPSLKIASTISLSMGPLILTALLDFSGIRRPRLAFLVLLPSLLLSAFQLAQVWTGSWVIAGFHASAQGNISEVTRNPFPIAVNQATSMVNALIGLGSLAFAWFRSQSRLYRKITLAIFALSLLANLWGVFGKGLVWLKWDRPDPTGMGAGLILVGYAILIQRYKHLTERKPDMTGPLLACLKGTVLFVDAHGLIVQAPEEAGRLLGKPLEGRPLFEALGAWPGLARNWEAMSEDLQPRTNLAGSLNSERYRLHLLPHRNPFDQFDGALVRIVPEGAIDESLPSFGLSSREQEVARLVCGGFDTRQIAEALFISPSTVKNHLHNLYSKTSTSGRADLVRALLVEAGQARAGL